ncbi:AAA family ATPase [uncultured Aliiroseovarius sp.]|uniref:DUF3696 domain-containing protein n=1 Tax=uncultured Aliiroseovarius sp. TaxID=1658783 RepID=UPI00262B7446|nr:AAA family ATPase [uncultured Aliiroseovarius sp.]
MKFSYAIENLRSLKQTKLIEIRPITLLVGKNSVGKSTFLRTFPLFRQTLETRSSAPVLWYGDHVDFGDFRSAVTDGDTREDIRFSFLVEEYAGSFRPEPTPRLYSSRTSLGPSFSADKIWIEYEVSSNSESTVLNSITISLPSQDSTLKLEIDPINHVVSKVVANGLPIEGLCQDTSILVPSGSLFECPVFFRASKSGEYQFSTRSNEFSRLVRDILKSNLNARFSTNTITREANRILRYPKLSQAVCEEHIRFNHTQGLRNFYDEMAQGKREDTRRFISALCEANHLFRFLNTIGEDLSDFFSEVRYIGPARARSERYYRQQELEISEISSDGNNLPMFLASLPEHQLADFSSWVEKAFGYGVTVRPIEGQVSIQLIKANQKINIVDTGYGVSQVLPVLAQIWWMQYNRRSRFSSRNDSQLSYKALAIEQPELHLHPAHQALLADVFVEALVEFERGEEQLVLLVETHSEALINRLGELIGEGAISRHDVQVVVFSDDPQTSQGGQLEVAEFDEEGALVNWPYGFFEYDG